MTVSRRVLLGGAIGAAGLGSNATGAPVSPDLVEPASRLATILRMRGAPGGKALWWYRGTFFGKPEGEMTRPLMRIDGASAAIWAPDGTARYRSVLEEAGFFSDLQTGEVLTEWRNPFTGQVLAPVPYRSRSVSLITADTVVPDVELPPGVEFRGEMTPFITHGDSVWVSEELFTRAPAAGPGGAAYRVQTSLATFHSRLSELQDPKLDFVPCEFNYSTLASWRPWMEMGDRPGVISWRLVGQKIRRAAQLPAGVAGWLRATHPDLYALMGVGE